MDEAAFRMFELHSQGFTCGQILLALGMDRRGEENPDLLRAVHGLAGGVGFSGQVCGALSGGVCLLALFLGKGTADEEPHEGFYDAIRDFGQWFQEEFGHVDCRDILGGEPEPSSYEAKCGDIVARVYEKAMDILDGLGVERDD